MPLLANLKQLPSKWSTHHKKNHHQKHKPTTTTTTTTTNNNNNNHSNTQTVQFPSGTTTTDSYHHHQLPPSINSLLTPPTTDNDQQPDSPSPLPPELTIAIIHQTEQHHDILTTIQTRLSATRFKIIESIQLQSPPANSRGLAPGLNTIYLLSRSRAIQAWNDLVGFEHASPNLPARPGSLRFMYGSNAIWAPDRTETVYEMIHQLWPNSIHLNHPSFRHLNHLNPSLLLPTTSTPTTTKTPPSAQSTKRVFKFSKCTPSSATEPVQLTRQTKPSQEFHIDDEPSEEIRLTQFAEPKTNEQDHSPTSQRKLLSRIPHKTSLSTSSPSHSLISHESIAVHQEPSSTQSSFTPASQHLSQTPTSLQPPLNNLIDSSSSHSSLSSSTLASSSLGSPMSAHNRHTSSDNSTRSSKTESPSAIKTHDSPSNPFRARPIPAAVTEPIPTPKMSKAAMLRLGLAWTPPVRPPPASQSSTATNSTISVRASVAPVASLNPPAVLPRPTKASTLRTNGAPADQHLVASSPQQAPRLKKTQSQIFGNTPGHGFRRANLQTNIASIAAPKTQPRPTKASALRTGTPCSPPVSSSNTQPNGKIPSHGIGQSVDYFQGVPGHKRQEKILVEATRRPEIEPRMTKASMLRMGGGVGSGTTTEADNGRRVKHAPSFARFPLAKSNNTHKLSLDQDSSARLAVGCLDSSEPGLGGDQHPATLPIDLSMASSTISSNSTKQRFGSVLIRNKPT